MPTERADRGAGGYLWVVDSKDRLDYQHAGMTTGAPERSLRAAAIEAAFPNWLSSGPQAARSRAGRGRARPGRRPQTVSTAKCDRICHERPRPQFEVMLLAVARSPCCLGCARLGSFPAERDLVRRGDRVRLDGS
jgi:hypothetical protein